MVAEVSRAARVRVPWNASLRRLVTPIAGHETQHQAHQRHAVWRYEASELTVHCP